MPDGVEIADYGIRGVHLAYRLLDGYDVLVLIDAAPRGHPPGTVTLVEVDQSQLAGAGPAVTSGASPLVDAHGMDPATMIAHLAALGGRVASVLIIACEPEIIEEGMGLSATVQAAVPDAIALVEQVMQQNDGSPEEVTTSCSLVIKLALVGIIAAAVVAAFPDVKRYLEIRHM